MMQIRRSADRGHAQHGWLDSHHTFSFGNYHDPSFMGFRALRVINEDRVVPGAGFPTHPHRDMEIISYVVEGALSHRDSMGTGSVIKPGDVQRMSAGSGVTHSEFNPSADEGAHFLQIWILPATRGLEPSYEQKHFELAEAPGELQLLASPQGEQGAVTVHQDVRLWGAKLVSGNSITHALAAGRYGYLQVVRGAVKVEGEVLQAGDGAAFTEHAEIALATDFDAEILLFDLS